MKRKYIFILCIELLILVLVVIPIAINELYKVGKGYHTVWSGADMLSYYGSVVCSLIAAFISIFTLIEMKVQRDKAYQPNIAFCHLRILVDTGLKEIDGIEVKNGPFRPAGENWDVVNNIKIEQIDFSIISRQEYYLYVTMSNTGVGVCKYLTCTFSNRSYMKWVDAFCTLGFLKKNSKSNTENPDETIYYPLVKNTSVSNFSVDSEDITVKEPFLTPNCQNEYKLKLPYNYLRLLLLITDLESFYKLKKNDLPPIEVALEYSDVQGKVYNQKVYIKFTAFSTTVSDLDSLAFIYDVTVYEK